MQFVLKNILIKKVKISLFENKISSFRGVAQLVARVVWDHQAAGSSPVTPTRQGLEPIRALGSFLYRGRDARALIGIFCIPGRHVGTSYARSDFLFHKKSVTCSTVPPLLQKSCLAHLFGQNILTVAHCFY